MDNVKAIHWGDGDPIAGTPFTVVVPADQAATLVLIAAEMAPGVHVDEHTHESEDQITMVVDGTIGVSCDGSHHELTAGSVIFLPRGLPHSLWNPTDRPARLLDAYTPPGIEAVFAGAGSLAGVRGAGHDERRVARGALL